MSIYISNNRILVKDSTNRTAFDTNRKMAVKANTLTVTKTFPGYSYRSVGSNTYLVGSVSAVPDFILATTKNLAGGDTTTNWNSCGSLLDYVTINTARENVENASVVSLWWSGTNIYLTQDYYVLMQGTSIPSRTLTFKIVTGVFQ